MKPLGRVRYIIWDMDQTLYPYWDDFADYCYEATAHCALEAGAPLTKAEADELARISYKERGVTTRLFYEQYGIDEVKLFQDHHKRMIDRLIEPNWESKIPENPELAEMLFQSRVRGVRHILLTNGSREWAQTLADKIGISQHFRLISGADDHKLRQKGRSIVPILSVLGRVGYFGDYSDVLIVEDSLANMKEPKEYGMINAWVQWDNPQAEKQAPAYVDHVFHHPNDVMKAWFAAQKHNKKGPRFQP